MNPSLMFFAIIGCLLQGAQSARWISTIQDGAELYQCVGSSIFLPWQYQLSPGDQLLNVQWTHNKGAEELVAMLAADSFLPLPAYGGGRVQPINNAGIVLPQATVNDAGSYTVEVHVTDVSGDHGVLRQTAFVHVGDDLILQDGQLQVQQTPEAMLNPDTDQWSIQLTCGVFNFHGSPLFSVEWTTPDGTTCNSTDFNNGTFRLLLSNSIRGGDYTCRIPPQHQADACIHNTAAQKGESTLTVDKFDARLSLLEKENERLKTVSHQLEQLERENSLLKNDTDARLSRLENENDQLRMENSLLKNDTDARFSQLQDENARLRNESSLYNNMTALVSQLETEIELLRNQDGSLQAEVQQLRQSVTSMQSAASSQVSFHARNLADETPPQHAPLVFRTVLTNHGNAYNASTGFFIAPSPGLYFFIATSGSNARDTTVSFSLKTESGTLDKITAYNEAGYHAFSTLHGIVHLDAGQRVWVEAGLADQYYGMYSTYSGFLLSLDP